jgi:mRNA interferase YafQ
MISKKAPSGKRAIIPRASNRTKEFKKDWDRYNRAARADMGGLKRVMLLLIANDGPLPAEYRDHELKGDWGGHRDCHVHGDFLLLYRLKGDGEDQQVTFVRIGTHSELFG